MISRRDLERVIENALQYADTEGMHSNTLDLLAEELTEEIYAFLVESEQNG